MSNWIAVGTDTLLQDGSMTELNLDQQRILLARVEGQYYAVQAFCSHMGGDFKKGNLNGFVVSCPRNRSRFDLRDGSVVEWLSRMPGLMRSVAEKVQHPKCLRTFATRIENGKIWVEVERQAAAAD